MQYAGDDFVSTWISIDNLSVRSISKNWGVLATILSLIVVFSALAIFARRLDLKDDLNQQINAQSEQKSESQPRMDVFLKLIDDSLPNIFQSKPVIRRCIDEVKHRN